jgi:excisionase family DNA binding protein
MIDLQTCNEYRLLSTVQVAEVLGVSAYRVRKLVADGDLPAVSGFRQFYFTVGTIRAFVARNGGPASTAPGTQAVH